MFRVLKNIARHVVVGFLLLALSGMTITIHHDHPIERAPDPSAVHHSNNVGDVGIQNVPSTYHEVHFIKLSSGDSFGPSPTTHLKASLKNLGPVVLDHIEFSPAYRSSSLTNIDTKETGPPSADKCVLLCRFLI